MLRTLCLSSVLALAGLATAASAEEHYVLMMGEGYFPDVVHPALGDTIRFINISDVPMAATASDDSWSTGLLLPEAEYVLSVTDGMQQSFANTLGAEAAGAEDGFVADASVGGLLDYLNAANTTTNLATGDAFVYN